MSTVTRSSRPRWGLTVGGALLALAFLAPYVVMLLGSLRSSSDNKATPPSFLPKVWQWSTYADVLAIETVLRNIDGLGLARTLALIDEVIRMCRESLEGQAIELGWIRQGIVPTRDVDYINMVTKKTSWYTCQSPCRLGAMAAGHTRPRELDSCGEAVRARAHHHRIERRISHHVDGAPDRTGPHRTAPDLR